MDKKIRHIPVSEKDLGLLDILFNASPESDEAFD